MQKMCKIRYPRRFFTHFSVNEDISYSQVQLGAEMTLGLEFYFILFFTTVAVVVLAKIYFYRISPQNCLLSLWEKAYWDAFSLVLLGTSIILLINKGNVFKV